MKTNILTNFQAIWARIVASRVQTKYFFHLTYFFHVTNFQEHWTENVVSRAYIIDLVT